MNMKKLMASVVAATVLVSNVAFAAVSTTTTYNAGTGKVDVKTTVSELTNGSMVTYVLYGAQGSDEIPFNATTGEIVGTAEKAPEANEQKDNIIYIDQINNVTENRAEFTAPGLNVGEAYGAKVIVGTDTSDDLTKVTDFDATYTGDMYTLKLSNDAADYTVTVRVALGDYIKEYTLSTAAPTVKVPVGADCKVTFKAAGGKTISQAYIDGTEIDSTSNLDPDPEVYVEGGQYVLSAVVENETNPAIITVSSPIKQVGSVMYLVTVNQFEDLRKTGLKVEFNGHTFANLVPVQYSDNYYAIEIKDDTDKLELGMTESTDYTVTAFVEVNDVPVYDGDQGSTDYLNPTYGVNVE